jgi:hypothetical protein
MVIDDFYANPLEVREQALKLTYPPSPPGTAYPGRTSEEKLLWPNSDQMFSQIMREPLRGKAGFAHGQFRLSREGDPRGADIHVDIGVVWAGILYLNLPEQCQGGTEFFRHRKYRTDGAPLDDEDLKAYRGELGATRNDVVRQLIDVEGTHRDNWDLLFTMPMRFNRLILFRAYLWHTAGISFGDSDENARLIQLFFWESATPAAAAPR